MAPTPEEIEAAKKAATDPIAAALQKANEELMAKVAALEAKITPPKMKEAVNETNALLLGIVEDRKEELVEKMLQGATAEQKKVAKDSIKDKGLPEAKVTIMAMAAMLPKPQVSNGVPVTSTGGVKSPAFFDKDYKHQYTQLKK